MRGTLKRYDGLYDRLFIAPTVFIGLGRWGNTVCDLFFKELLTTFAPSQRSALPNGAPKTITDCFSKLAWVRDMDRSLPELGWASDIHCWPANLDEVDAERFSDIIGEDSLVSFWSTPRSCFRSALEGQWQTLVPTVKRLQERVSSATWRDGCRGLGLQVPPELESTDKWIVTVGSLFEPEVGVVIADLARFIQEDLRAGQSGYKFLHIVDVGIPDEPGHENEIWATCPQSLQAQLLSSVEELGKTSETAIVFFSASTDRTGFRVASAARMGSALGVLRSYFTSALLSPRDRFTKLSSVFKSPKEPTAVSADRASVFMEFALDLDNLDTLIARELLGRWKRRFCIESAPLVTFEELVRAFDNRPNPTRSNGTEFFVDLAKTWFQETGLSPRQDQILEEFKSWITAGKEHLLESIARDAEKDHQPLPVRDRSFWHKLKTLFGASPRPPMAQSIGGTESLRGRVEFSDEILGSLAALITLIREVTTPESVFQDVTHDTHLEIAAVTSSTFVARYRRLPQESDCPPAIRAFLSRSEVEIPVMILGALRSPQHVAAQVIQQVSARWNTETKGQTPDTRWEWRGIAQWIRHDISLSNQMARYAITKLVPLWKLRNYRIDNWHGFLTVFDYGVELSCEPTTLSYEILKSLRRAFDGLRPEAEMTFGASKRGYRSVFENDTIWERWPSIYSFGLLWTDTARDGMGFLADWDNQEFVTAGDEWKSAFPAEAAWISCRGQGDEVNSGGTS